MLASNATPGLDRPNLPRIPRIVKGEEGEDDGGGDGGTASVAGKPAIIPNPNVGSGFGVCNADKGEDGAGDETEGAA